MRTFQILLVFVSAVLFSCSSEPKKTDNKDTAAKKAFKPNSNKDMLLEAIRAGEAKVYSDENYKEETATALITAYTDYASAFPGDSVNTPDYLFKAASIAKNSGERNPNLTKRQGYFNQTLVLLRQVEKYPSYQNSAPALYLQALVYDHNLNDDNQARVQYNKVINTYPDHKLAQDSQEAIKLLGKSDKDLIREFEKKNNIKRPGTVRLTFPVNPFLITV